MKYEIVKTSIKTGDIISCSGNAIYSKIIRKWGSFENWIWERKWIEDEITHVGLAIWITLPHDEVPDRLCILESHAFKGVRLNPLSAVLKDDYWPTGGKVYWQKLKDPMLDGVKVAGEGLKYWTKAYAPLKQFIVAGLRIDQWIRKKLRLAIDIDKNRLHCSELVTQSLIDAGFIYGKEPSVTTPQQVSNFSCLGEPILLEL